MRTSNDRPSVNEAQFGLGLSGAKGFWIPFGFPVTIALQ